MPDPQVGVDFIGHDAGLTAAATGAQRAIGGVSRAASGAGRAFHATTGALSHAAGQIGRLVSSPLGMLGLAGGVFELSRGLTESVGSASRFSGAMELLHTQAGVAQDQIGFLTDAVLKLSPQVATGPEELAAGLYHLASAGLRGQQAMDALKVAAEGAKIGGANLEDVTNALNAVIVSGVKGSSDFAAAMGALNATVGAGDMRMQDLADAMGTGLLAQAKLAGVSLQDVSAALAVFGDNNIRGAKAGTQLASAIRLLSAPSKAAETQLKTIGLTALGLAKTVRTGGLPAALQLLESHIKKAGLTSDQAGILITRAFGGKQAAGIKILLEQYDRLQTKEGEVAKGASSFGEDWQATMQQSQFAFQDFQTAVSVLGIKIGSTLMPLATEAARGLTGFLTDHGDEIVSAIRGAADTAKAVFSVVSSVAGAIGTFWNSLPEPFRDVLVKGVVADKVVSFLFGIDPAKAAIHVVASGIETALGRALGTGLAQAGLGKLFVQPVFVTNPGFGVGGGLGGAATGAEEAAAGAAGAGGLATLGVVFAGTLGALLETKGGIDALTSELDNLHRGDTTGAMRDLTTLGSPGSMIARGLFGSSDPIGDWVKSALGGGAGHAAPSAFGSSVVDMSPGARDERAAALRSATANEATASHTEALNAGLSPKVERQIAAQETANAHLAAIQDKRESHNITNLIRVNIPITDVIRAGGSRAVVGQTRLTSGALQNHAVLEW